MNETRDAALAGLVESLGLEWPPGLAAWEERLRARLDSEVYAEYLEHRYGSPGYGPGASSTFHDFVGRHFDLAILMQEGRLGYHGAVLPAVAEAIAGGPQGAILDLGCNCGLTTLYLARRFPGSRVVGIERSVGLVEAARSLRARSGTPNAEFVCGDYTRHPFERPFDVVVSLQTMPAYFLPFIPSERPESCRRGAALAALAADPVLPHRRVGCCLAAVRGLLSAQGMAVLHERLASPAQLLLFTLLAAKAGLGPRRMSLVTWEAANETQLGQRTSPLILAEALAGQAEFAEDRVIDLFQPPAPSLPAPPAPGSNRTVVVTGPLAQQTFQAIAPGSRRLCIKAAERDGRRRHVHLGVVPDKAAFGYSCDTFDTRSLKLADVRQARPLFAAEGETIARAVRCGEITSLEPRWEELPALLEALGRA